MGKNIWNNTWYVLSKTWRYEKKVLFIIALQTVIGAVVPLAGVALPALVVNGISNRMDSGITVQIAAVILLLLICNTVSAYLSNVYGTYLLNDKIGFLSALFRKKMKVVGLFTDSTEAVKTNRALDRSEKLFKSIFANIPAGVEIYDKDGFLIDLNNKDLEIFGVENKQDVIGVNFFENPNVPQHIRDRVRDEDLVDFRLNYSFERAEGYYHPHRRDTIDIYRKVSKHL